jgi:corrinoid protein of di/trimethylamine methyltransferase
MEENEILEGLCQAIIDGEPNDAVNWANKALKEKIDLIKAAEEGLGKGLRFVGDAFGRGEAFIPDLVLAADAMKAGSRILEAELEKTGVKIKSLGIIVIGTVAGDLHDIGKTLVSTLFKAAGFTVYDLGIDVPTEKFVTAVKEKKPDILGLSSLLTTTIKEQKVVIDALKEAGIRDQVKVMVGGGAVAHEWADKIGADSYGEDAQDAVEKGKQLLKV